MPKDKSYKSVFSKWANANDKADDGQDYRDEAQAEADEAIRRNLETSNSDSATLEERARAYQAQKEAVEEFHRRADEQADLENEAVLAEDEMKKTKGKGKKKSFW